MCVAGSCFKTLNVMLHIRLKITCDDILHNGTHITHNILDIIYCNLQYCVMYALLMSYVLNTAPMRSSGLGCTKHCPYEVIRARVSLRNLANYTIPMNTGLFNELNMISCTLIPTFQSESYIDIVTTSPVII